MSRNPLFSRHMTGIVSVILLTFFLFSFTTATAAPLATTIVSPATPNGWIWGLESGTNGSVTFVSGPAIPPAGTGSARFQTGNNTTGVVLSRNGIYPGLRFDDITTLTYDLYKASGSSATNDAIFQVNVDYNLTDANTAWQGRLVYEPYYFSSLPTDTWTSLNPLTDGAGWWATGAPGNGVCPISNPCTWSEVLTAFPTAGVQTGTLAAIHFKAGAGWTTPFNGNVDNLHIMADGGIDDTYDFDNSSAGPGPACTTICYVSPLGSDTNGGASANDPLRNIQTGITNVSTGGTVMVAAGTYFEALTVNKWLTLDGAGSGANPLADTLVVNTNLATDILTVSSGGASVTDRSVIRDIRFTRLAAPGASDIGDGVFINAGSFLTFDNVASTLHSSNGFNFGAGPVNDLRILNSTLSNNFGNGWRSASGTVLDGFLFESSTAANNRGFGLITGGGSNSSTHNNITLRNSTFTANSHSTPGVGSGDVSFFLYNGNLSVEDVTINGVAGPAEGPHIGFQLRGANTPAPSGTVDINGLTITGNYRRPGAPSTPGNSFRLTNYGAGSSISINDLDIDSGTNTVGVLLSGLSDTIDLDNASLDGSAVIAIEGSAQNNSAASNANATSATVNGVAANMATLAQLFAIEDVIYHRIDVGTPVNTNQAIGLVRVRANNVYVTVNSFLAPFTTTPSIQRGIAAASVGDTVNVGAGRFNEAVTIDKSLTLDGVGAGTNPAIHTILDGNSPSATTGNGITLNSGVTNVTIQDLRVQEYGGAAPGGSGIHGTGGNNNTTIQRTELVDNNLSNAANGGGVYMNGPVSNVTIDDNDAINNRSRGIVIWNGFKQDITITNNYVANNICCGIELQDGTASGVTVTGNTVENNGDSGMAFIGLTDGAGANLIANNTITNNGRFGIEIKLPDGNGTDTGDGSIVVETNQISRTLPIGGELRDLAGISVYRRGWVAGNNNVDIPTGVIVRGNTVNGYQQPGTSDGFGIVVEGVNHQVTNNTLNNNDVGVQAQGGHLPYTPNSNIDGDQSNLNDQYFGRGNAPIGCPVSISGNTFAGNATDTRFVGPAGGYRATNINTTEQFCTIQAAINDADTLDGHTIQVVAGTHIEQLIINKAITLEGAQAGVPAKDRVGAQTILRWSGNTPPISLSDDNITIDGFVLNGQGANTPWIINGVGEPNNGVYNNISILNNEFIGDAGPHTAQNDPGGVYMIGATNTLFEGNYFNELGSHAVFMGQTSDGTTYRNNDSYRNYLSGFSAHIGSHTNVLVENNRSIEDSMILFNLDGAVIQNNVFTATATTSARIYLGGGSSAVTVDGNAFNGVRSAAIISFDPGFGYGGNSNITITNNTITATVTTLALTDVGLIDLRDTSGTNLVSGNTVTVQSGTLGVNSVRGISLRNGMGTTTIAANTINGNNVDTSPATPSIGIYLQSDLSATSNTTIRNNVISGWNSGVEGGTLAAGVVATVFENNLSGNTPNAVANGAGTLLNASANWYGTNTPAGVDALVSTNVDYTPWFNVGTDTNGAAGWQGNFSWLNADDDSPQTGTTGRINEAITLVTTGGTVNLAAGIYNETATIPKSLTLQGVQGEGVPTILDGNTPSATTGNGITINSGITHVTIQDMRVQDYGGNASGGSGIFGTLSNHETTIQRILLYNNNLANVGNGGGLYMNGPVDSVVIHDNSVVNNRGRGIVIWNGLKTDIKITHNYVANNICCGIELQDGTAEGVTVTQNIVENNGDSGMSFVGLQGGGGLNFIAANVVLNNGRFGIEIKLPNGNGMDTGDGAILLDNNTIIQTPLPGPELRDVAGISVYRRGWVAGNNNVDIPVGVVIRNNTVNGYTQPSTSEGFGIVVEGVNHQILNNTLNDNDVGIQIQGGHLPYTPNTNIDGDQSNLNDQFFGRGNAPLGCAAVSGNTFVGNGTNTRSVGNGGAGIRATNTTTLETFCTIQAAIDDANTIAGHTIEVAAGTFEEQVEVNKAITLEGQGEGVTTIVAPLDMPDFFNSGADNNYPIIYVHDVNATIRDLTVDGDGRGNLNYRFLGVAFEQAGGTLENVTITGITETPFNGNQHGNGIWGRANNGTARTLTVTNVTLTDFQKNGTVFTGANLTVTMDDSTVVGSGPLGLGFPAQNGIQLSGGATGSFDNNDISDIVYTPATFAATGYLVSDASGMVNITNCDITNTTTAIYYINTQGNLTDNTIVNTPAGMGSAVYWWGAIVYNTTAAPLTAERKPALPDAVDTADEATVSQAALLNRSYTIEGNTFTGGGGGDGLSVYADAPEVATMTINENSVDDWAVGVYLDGAGTLNANVTANSVTNSDVGIQSERGTVGITNNVIDNNGTGVWVSGTGTIAPTIYQNSIVSTGLGVNKTAAGIALVNASANWWGSNVPATVVGEVSAGVDYTPWFAVSTDNAPAAGWQGNFSTLHADDNSPQTSSAGRVQEAVTLVNPNGLVYAEAGTYEETVSINGKDLTVEGRGKGISTILSSTSVPGCWAADRHPIICIQNTGNVTFRDLTVDGDGRGNGDAIFYGIAYRNAGGTVEDVTIVDVAETPMNGVQSGVALYACADNGTARTLAVDEVTLTGFQKNGTAFNCANLTVTMSDSVVTGAGPVNFIAQNGIQLAFGANGSFSNNTISNVGYTPTSDNGTGYLLYQASGTTSITGSDLEDVEVGAYAYDSAMTFNGNVITQTTTGMAGMPTWFGVFIASDVPAPLAPNATVQPVEDGNAGGSANAVMNRTHTLNGNTMTSEGRVGTAIGTDVDAPEVTTLNIITNTLSTWDVGIEVDGDGLLAATVDDSYINDNAVGVVIRTGVLNITNNFITVNAVGIRYFDSDGVEPEVHFNDIDYNTSSGIEHMTFPGTTTIVDATQNYWGDPSGPLDIVPGGTGACPSLGEYNPTSPANDVTECVRWAFPLAVTLANFEAIARANDILVTWETASETDNLGFNLYRATTPDGTPEQLNGELIPSQAPGGGGALYEWEDVNVEAGVTYFYWLEAVDIQGNGSPYFGPVSATYGAPTAVTLSDLNAQPATLPMLLAAGLVLLGAVGVVIVRRRS